MLNYFGDTIVLLGDVTIGGGGAATTQSATTAEAPAAEAEAQAAGGLMSWAPMIILYGGLFAALWFFMFRPQRKKAKEAKEMREALKSGDRVVTSNGFFGTIVSVGTDSFLIDFGEGKGVRIWVRKEDILGTREPVTTPPAV